MFNGFIDVLKRCYVSYNVNNNNSNDMQCLMCFKFILKPHFGYVRETTPSVCWVFSVCWAWPSVTSSLTNEQVLSWQTVRQWKSIGSR